jgi:Ras homolog gene family, member A
MGATYMECSSKHMTGVDEIFDTAITIAVGDEYKYPNEGGLGASFRKRKRSCKIL